MRGVKKRMWKCAVENSGKGETVRSILGKKKILENFWEKLA